jgi:hypothetical protein
MHVELTYAQVVHRSYSGAQDHTSQPEAAVAQEGTQDLGMAWVQKPYMKGRQTKLIDLPKNPL